MQNEHFIAISHCRRVPVSVCVCVCACARAISAFKIDSKRPQDMHVQLSHTHTHTHTRSHTHTYTRQGMTAMTCSLPRCLHAVAFQHSAYAQRNRKNQQTSPNRHTVNTKAHTKRHRTWCSDMVTMTTLKRKLLHCIVPIVVVGLLSQLLLTAAYMQSVRIDEIPFGRGVEERRYDGVGMGVAIHAKSRLGEPQRGFLHIFNVPYIVCFFAARGKWPFIPQFMQPRVDSTAKSLFSQNDSSIRQFCSKWMQIKECFRPIFAVTTTTADPVRVEIESLAVRATSCPCAAASAGAEATVPVIFFDRDHIGNVSAETVRNTIEFLETFLPPPPTRKSKRKNRVRSRVDEMDIE